jgi:hypothetical protein
MGVVLKALAQEIVPLVKGLLGLAFVVFLLYAASHMMMFDFAPSPSQRSRVGVLYDATLTFVPEGNLWTIEETLAFDPSDAGLERLEDKGGALSGPAADKPPGTRPQPPSPRCRRGARRTGGRGHQGSMGACHGPGATPSGWAPSRPARCGSSPCSEKRSS